MRKSFAPSQIASKNKRPKFCTPYLNLNKSEIDEIPSSKVNEDLSNKQTIRSNDEILRLISGLDNVDDCLDAEVPEAVTTQEIKQNTDNKPLSTSNGFNSSGSSNLHSTARYFGVVWCNLSKKKHKTWAGDAILKVNGNSLHLFDMEGKEIGQCSGYKSKQLTELEEGQTLVIGSKEIEITDRISEEKFKTGTCFSLHPHDAENVERKPSKDASKPFVKPLKSKDKSAKQVSSPTVARVTAPPADAFILPRPPGSHEWNNNQEGQSVVDVWVDPFLSRHLRPHQKEGVAFLYRCVLGMNRSMQSSGMEGGAILADEMGLGKTIQCISLIWTLYKQGPYGGRPIIRRVLIVVPGSLVKNWMKEFKKWLTNERMSVYDVSPKNKVENFMHSKNQPVMVISYDMLLRNIETISRINFDLLVCDEGHKLKNSSNKTTQSIKGLNIKRRIILTGTPVQNDLQELYTLIDFCLPNILGSSSSFKHVFENPILASRQTSATDEEILLGQERAFQLNRITSQLILRRTQEINNKYLPPKVDIVLFCSLSPFQLMLYNKLVNSKAIKSCISRHFTSSSLSSSSSFHSAPQHLTCISALRKLCNHPDLVYEACRSCTGGVQKDLEEEIEESLYSGLLSSFPEGYDQMDWETRLTMGGKMNVLSKLLRSFKAEEKRAKVVVVSNYTKTLDLIENLCRARNYQFLRLDGKMVTSKRMEVVERFNNPSMNDFVFLLSTKAGGVGLNLIGASRLVLFDIDWNPANDLQAMARIWRDGQKWQVFVYRLISSCTIEERMYQRQVTKQGLSGVVVDLKDADSRSLPTFSAEQLKELFSPVGTTSLCTTHDMLPCDCCREDDGKMFDQQERSKDGGFDLNPFLAPPKKNSCMDELMDWKHIPGPDPDLSVLDPLLMEGDFADVTFAFSAESNA